MDSPAPSPGPADLVAALRRFYGAEPTGAAMERGNPSQGRGPYEHNAWPGPAVARYRSAFLTAVADEKPEVRAGFVATTRDAWRASLTDAAAHMTGAPGERLAVGFALALADERLLRAAAGWQATWRLLEAPEVAPWVVEAAARLWLAGLSPPASVMAPYIEPPSPAIRVMDRLEAVHEVAWSPHEPRAHARRRLLRRGLPASWVDGFLDRAEQVFTSRGMARSREVRRTGVDQELGAIVALARFQLGESAETIARTTVRYRKRQGDMRERMAYPVTKQSVHGTIRETATLLGLNLRA